MAQQALLNEDKLHELVGAVVGDLGAAISGALVVIGDRLGLYRALADGPAGSTELAERTGTNERYVREWLANQAASGYVEYDAAHDRYGMSAEQAACFALADSPALMTGGFWAVASVYNDEEKLADTYKHGGGIAWGDHHPSLFCGTAKFFKPGYEANLVQSWLPALDGVVPKLERGANVADVGCGWGLSTMIMAAAYPNSEFTGFDIHPPSIERANEAARRRELPNVRFKVATAKAFYGGPYDLVTCFDCLHDMGDPAGAAEHVREQLADDGTWMIVEPFANDALQDNLNPVGRVYYGFSATVCTPASKSQEVGAALGAQAGEKRLRGVIVGEGGFTRFRRAAETPFNLILEARR